MKDKKFLELLNLYLDGELDPAGAVELEQEVLANPSRRRVYNDYCRIHRATKLVYEQFSAAGAAPIGAEPLPSTRPGIAVNSLTGTIALDGRTGGRAARRPFRVAIFATGLAAACAAGVFIGSELLAPRGDSSDPGAVAVTPAEASPPAAPTAVATTQTATPAPTAAAYTAPIAPEFRVDPFVQFPQTRNDPFALSSLMNDGREFDSQLPAAALLPTPVVRIDPSFRPASQGFESGTANSPEATARNPFRVRENRPAAVESTNDFGVRQQE
jgi:hypothetical protein